MSNDDVSATNEEAAGTTETPTPTAAPESENTGSKQLARGAKTQSVRDALKSLPSHSPKEIADKLTAQGIPVTAAFVSSIKFHMKHGDQGAAKAKSAGGRVGRPKKTAVAVPDAKASGASKASKAKKSGAASKSTAAATSVDSAAAAAGVTVEGLVAAKALADQLGGVAAAVRAIAALGQLLSQ